VAAERRIAVHLKTIEIDFEIHKLIESERRGFDEPEYIALRRLLKLPDALVPDQTEEDVSREGLPFVEDGVSILHGSDARMRYLRGTQLYEGRFLDGKLVVDGKAYPTLSAAASDLARTKDGNKTSLNGWLYWEVRAPGTAKWRAMKDLRDQAQQHLKNVKKWI
jgi:hypothetical protein